MNNELIEIIQIENATPFSWFDWWSYWSTFIGIIAFVSVFLLLTVSVYSIRGVKEPSTDLVVAQDTSQETNMDTVVATLLSQKGLTL